VISLIKKMNQFLEEKLIIEDSNSIFFIRFKDIIFFEKENNLTTKIYLKSGEIKYTDKPLKYFLDYIKMNPLFFNCNDCSFINLIHLQEYLRGDKECLIMTNNIKIMIDQDKTKAFMKKMEEIFYL